MEIIKEFRNNLLRRREIKVIKGYDSNPGFEKVKEDISKKFNESPEKVFVKNIISKFGKSSFFIDFFIYDSAEDMKSVEVRNKKKKEAGK